MILTMSLDWITGAGIHCAPRMHEYFGTKTQGLVRFSFSYYNTEEEVTAAADAMLILDK